MRQQSKRTRAPAPHLIPPSPPQFVPPPAPHPILPSAPQIIPPSAPQFIPSSAPQLVPPLVPHLVSPPRQPGPGAWIPPRPPQAAAASAPCWIAQAQGPLWHTSDNSDDLNPESWGLDSHPPGGFLGFLNNTPSLSQAVSKGSSSQKLKERDATNGAECARTEKHLLWTKDEDLRLVGAWLNNSNDPIQSNYKKNDQYWKDVAAVYNSTTPKNRERLVKQVKDRFGRIKKRVAWFCASYKEANALYASGESDADLKKRALQTYEADHKEDGPFMFEHCWEFLKQQPKWDAYLERLEYVEPDKRKFSIDDKVGQHFTIDDDKEERPPGGKKAKDQRKRKTKDEGCIIDLEDEISRFVDAQNAANEGCKEMLETQRRVSSENLEARKLACLAAKDHKESIMLETYRSLMMQDTTRMSEDVRSEHVAALKCFREKLFGQN